MNNELYGYLCLLINFLLSPLCRGKSFNQTSWIYFESYQPWKKLQRFCEYTTEEIIRVEKAEFRNHTVIVCWLKVSQLFSKLLQVIDLFSIIGIKLFPKNAGFSSFIQSGYYTSFSEIMRCQGSVV